MCPAPSSPTPHDDLGPVFRALADPTRRAILDLLRAGAQATGDVCAAFPRRSRFAVLKHLGVLRRAGLVQVRSAGRVRWNRLHAGPLLALYDRWLRAHLVATSFAAAARPRLPLHVEPPDSRVRSPGAAHRPLRRRRRDP